MKTTIQPQVTVRVPEVKLKLKDLTYLRSLSGDAKIHCTLGGTQLNHLRVLGLVEEVMMPPLPSVVSQTNTDLERIAETMSTALAARDYQGLARSHYFYEIQRLMQKLEPRKETVLTDIGRELLTKGAVTTKISKLGCL